MLVDIIHLPFVSSRYKGKYVVGEEEVGVNKSRKKKKKAKRASVASALRINCDYSSSVILVIRRILKIINSKPTVTITSRTKPNQPSTIAEAPTPLFTLPLPMSWAIVLAATDAVCCQRTDTRTNTEATKMRASAAWETAREGKGLTS